MKEVPVDILETDLDSVVDVSNWSRFLKYYVGCNPDAYLFITAWTIYSHGIDDIIDGDNTDPIFIIKTFELAAMLYASDFYLAHLYQLRPIVLMASNTYMTSVTLEQDPDKQLWKSRVSDALRQTGNELVLAVIDILHGIDVRIKASLEMREIAWKLHHDKDGNPR